MENLQSFVTVQDASGVEIIWSCCIICLAHLAALSHLMSQTDPVSSVSMNRLCNIALGNLGNLSLEVHIGAYGYSDFDRLTGVGISRCFISSDEVRRLPKYSTSSDFLEKGIGHDQCSHWIEPRHEERIVAALENGYQHGTCGFSRKLSRARAQLICFVCYFDGWTGGGF